MYLAELRISNFRQFGAEDPPFTLPFNPGVTALVGENDAGKTAIIDAIRYVLLTRDVEYMKVQDEDFHIPEGGGQQTREITLRCKFLNLSLPDKGAFAEFLTYEGGNICLYVHWQARRLPDTGSGRRRADVLVHAGPDGAGPPLDATARDLLATAYLKPLRDAERELSPGRGSRLSQILSAVESVKAGAPFDSKTPLAALGELDALSLLGLSDFMRGQVEKQPGLQKAETSINSQYLDRLTLQGDGLLGRIRFSENGSEETRLRRLLERLELGLNGKDDLPHGSYGLGSNNLLFMACELLLLGNVNEGGLPLLLVEEPEAHLHPQRQLRLMQFLEEASKPDPENTRRAVQVILTTHSPNLASQIPVQNLVLLKGGRAYPLAEGETHLDRSDYRFLYRFLDVTKSNLFFARGVIIVEGAAEAILLPAIAKLLGLDLTTYGISIVNVGHTGLSRFSRIFQRQKGKEMGIRVACVTDMDVMPDCAPEILGLTDGPRRKWLAKRHMGADEFEQILSLQDRRDKLSKGDGQGVCTFVADEWTLEYALAYAGLETEVFEAAWMAKNDEAMNEKGKTPEEVRLQAGIQWQALQRDHVDQNERCTHIYKLFHDTKASKAIGAQYLAQILEERYKDDPQGLWDKLPSYITGAIGYVTAEKQAPPGADEPAPEVPGHA